MHPNVPIDWSNSVHFHFFSIRNNKSVTLRPNKIEIIAGQLIEICRKARDQQENVRKTHLLKWLCTRFNVFTCSSTSCEWLVNRFNDQPIQCLVIRIELTLSSWLNEIYIEKGGQENESPLQTENRDNDYLSNAIHSGAGRKQNWSIEIGT